MTQHAIERLSERYGVEATMADIQRAEDAVGAGDAVLLARGRGCLRYLVRICGVAAKAVVVCGRIVTVEPPGVRRPRRKDDQPHA